MSRNFTFNENEEPKTVTSSNVPGLPAEGEQAKITNPEIDVGPNPVSDQTPKDQSEVEEP